MSVAGEVVCKAEFVSNASLLWNVLHDCRMRSAGASAVVGR